MPWSSLRNKPTDKTNQRREKMNNKFDKLTKQMAQSTTRREALKVFGAGLAGMALACVGLAGVGLALVCVGLANKAEAKGGGTGCKQTGSPCTHDSQCCSGVCTFNIDRGGNHRFICA